jgi:hypothetical protein
MNIDDKLKLIIMLIFMIIMCGVIATWVIYKTLNRSFEMYNKKFDILNDKIDKNRKIKKK